MAMRFVGQADGVPMLCLVVDAQNVGQLMLGNDLVLDIGPMLSAIPPDQQGGSLRLVVHFEADLQRVARGFMEHVVKQGGTVHVEGAPEPPPGSKPS